MRLKLLLILSLIGAGCAASGAPARTDTSEDENGVLVEGTGTVRYVDLEGGFYGIVDEEGVQYDPINLDDAFREDGLQVHFLAQTRDDVMTIRMWGTVVEIIAIERNDTQR